MYEWQHLDSAQRVEKHSAESRDRSHMSVWAVVITLLLIAALWGGVYVFVLANPALSTP